MRKFFKFSILLCTMLFPAVLAAQEEKVADAPRFFRHEFRLGVGDPQGIIFYDGLGHDIIDLGDFASFTGYMPIYNVDYFYSVNSWFKVGAKVGLTFTTYNHRWRGDIMDKSVLIAKGFFTSDLWVMPSVKFVYYNKPWVRLYSGASIGVNYRNGGSFLIQDQVGLGFDVTAVAVSVGKNHWFGDLEFGCTFGTATMAVLPSRILTLSAGYRF